jgi:O-methyltransferase involved in polyketide biosynthesis
VWQGVTYFLTEAAVDRTLAFIATGSPAGSAIIFDYVYAETLADPHLGKALRRASRMSGESYVFGIARETVQRFLAERGFCDVRDVPMERVRELYFTGRKARRGMAAGFAIASARVAGAKRSS